MAKRTPKPSQDLVPYIGAMILPGEPSQAVSARNIKDETLVARAVAGTVATACSMNVSVLVQQPLRLYRGVRAKGKEWRGRAVRGKRAHFLHGQHGLTPGTKAVGFAAMAGEVEEVVEHPILDLLRDPDPEYSASDAFWLMWWFKESVGRFYWYLADLVGTAPASLYAMFPQWTNAIPSETELVAGYRYGRDFGEQLTIPKDRVLPMRHAPGVLHPLGATSWVQGVIGECDLESAAMRSEIARWLNGGQPSGIFEADSKINPQAMAQTKADLERQIRGVNKHGGFLIVQNLKAIPSNIKPAEMAYVPGLELIEKRIFRAAGIPETVWKQADSNKASAVAGDPQYMAYTIHPRLCKTAEEFNYLLPCFGIEIGEYWFAYDNPVKEDRTALVTEASLLVREGNAYPNELRTLLGYDPLDEGGDVLRYNGVPLGVMGAPTEYAVPAEDEADKEGVPAEEIQAAPQTDVQAAALNGAQVAALQALVSVVAMGQLPVENGLAIAHVSFPNSDPELIAAAFDGLDKFSEDSRTDEEEAAKRAEAQTQDESPKEEKARHKAARGGHLGTSTDHLVSAFANELAGWLEPAIAGSVGEDGALSLPGTASLDEIITRHLSVVFRSAAVEALINVGAPSDSPLIPTPPEVLQAVNSHALELATSVTGTTADRVRAVLAASMRDGATPGEMRDAVRSVAKQLSESQAYTIARTETTTLTNIARIEMWKKYDPTITHKIWDAAGEPCPICSSLDAESRLRPVPIDGTFSNGKQGPAAHPNCRCGVVEARMGQ